MAGINIIFNKIKVAANAIKAGAALWVRGVFRAENTGNRGVDFSGNENTVTANTGRFGFFNGTSSRAIATTTITGIKTASAWVKPSASTDSLFDFDGGSTTIGLLSGAVATKGITSPTIYVNATETTTITTGVWQLITVTSFTAWSSTSFTFGEEAGNWFSGSACYLRLFADELTASQIEELFKFPERVSPFSVQPSRLLFFIPLTEGAAISSYNSSAGYLDLIYGVQNITFSIGGEEPCPQTALLNSRKRVYTVSDTYVNIPDSDILDFDSSSNFSIVAKVWIRSTAGSQGIVVKDALNSAYALSIQSTNIDFRGAGATGALTFSPSVLTVYHIVVTVSGGTTAKLYVNGVEEDSGTITAPASTAGAVQLMGYGSANELSGFMYYAAIYNKVLTASEVKDFDSGMLPNEVSGSNLIGYWVNDGETEWLDRSGNGNTGTVAGTAATIVDIEGQRGKSLLKLPLSEFRKNRILLRDSGYLLVDDDATIDATTAITIECWVKLYEVDTVQQFVLKTLAYGLKVQADNTVRFSFWQTTEKTLDSTATLSAGVWYHVAATYDGTDAFLYIDGSQAATTDTHTGNIDSNANNLFIGASTTEPANPVNGDINNVRVYTTAATALEVVRNFRKQQKLQDYE